MVEAGFLLQPQDAYGLQQAQGAQAVHVGGVLGAFKAHRDMALCAQVVDFIGLCFLHDADEVAGVAEVAVMQVEARIVDVRILVDMVHALGVERRSPALDTVDDVAFFQQQLGQVRAVLPSDAGDECDFGCGRVAGVADDVHAGFFRKSA